MILRNEQPGDADAIRNLTAAAFATAPHASGTEAVIVDALRETGALHLSLVAEEDGVVIGHAAFSPVLIGGRDCGWFGLGPVSAAPARQRSGIGAALIRRGLAHLRAEAAAGCVVLGDPGYYRRFGFAPGGLRYPGPPPEYFLQLAFGGDAPAGVVTYAPAFGAAP